MKQIIKELLKRGDFVQSVAEEMGQALAREQINDHWFSEDWSAEFYRTIQETVNKAVLEAVNDYMEQHKVKGLIDTTVRSYLVKTISEALDESKGGRQ